MSVHVDPFHSHVDWPANDGVTKNSVRAAIAVESQAIWFRMGGSWLRGPHP